MAWRDVMCGELRARRRRPPRHGRRLGRHAPRPRRARLRRPPRPHGQAPARHQPGALAGRRGDRARDPQRVRPPGDRRGRGARAGARSTRTSRPARSRCRSTSCGSSRARRRCPFQLDEENVDETLRLRYRWLDMRTERMQRNLRLNHTAISAIRRVMDDARLRRRLDAEHDARHARGRARLPHAGAPAARASSTRSPSRRSSSSSSAWSAGSTATTRSPPAGETRISAPTASSSSASSTSRWRSSSARTCST